MNITTRKCQHNPCACLIDDEAVFCSPECERRADQGEGPPCACGHPDCDTAIGLPDPLPA